MLTLQVADVPLQAPLQPVNLAPVPALAVKVTELPLAKGLEQSLPQAMPAGDDVTVPAAAALPALATLSVNALAKLAVTDRAAVMPIEQVLAAPEQSPVHPENTEPASAVAVSETDGAPL